MTHLNHWENEHTTYSWEGLFPHKLPVPEISNFNIKSCCISSMVLDLCVACFLMFCHLVQLPCKNYQCPRNMGNSLASVLPCNQEPYTPMQNGTIALWASTVMGSRAEETWPDTEPWPHMLWRTDLENGPRRLLTNGSRFLCDLGLCMWCHRILTMDVPET